MRYSLSLLLVLAACADPRAVQRNIAETESTLKQANMVYARLCAPEELALAESSLEFSRIEFNQGYLYRGSEHVEDALAMSRAALEKATPCGTADRDADRIPDVVDRCPDEPEDYDGVDDEDGCRDIDPNGDEDGDGIINIDDGCMEEPEDFDGHDDEDGCPETSEDQDGDGYIDVKDGCPAEPEDFDGYQDADGCPDLDDDADGIKDMRDRCPRIPEDLDGWEDEDGCPDPDNDMDGIPDDHDACPNQPGERLRDGCPEVDRDHDGIADELDACPDQPETVNAYLDEDGCPDTPPSRVHVTRTRIEINEVVQFASGSAQLLEVSYPLLDDVAQVLKDASAMRVRIEGHTDSQGSDTFNQTLSEKRAASVRDYLVSRGVEANRLESAGLGETQPLDTNRTPEGRAANRRVEFHILE
ncbi:MAG: OmpA family protein [Deltaproteobacteria bacterium]|nr:OmpA family protein [Deltaproteobacteria bacterium]